MVALPLVVGGILWLPTLGVALIAAALLLVGAWEWARLVRLNAAPWRALFTLAVAAVFIATWQWRGSAVLWWILAAALVWWLLAALLVRRFPRGWDMSVGLPGAGLALGLLLLAATFAALLLLHAGARGPLYMLGLFALIWAADTGAYFAGRALGRHKLAPNVSPGKTVEGAAGGLLLALFAAALAGWLLGLVGATLAGFVVLGAVTAAVSVVGDLSVSMFKRQAGVKDSGTLFPGHGGVLDRLDSLLAAAPVYVLGLTLLGVSGA